MYNSVAELLESEENKKIQEKIKLVMDIVHDYDNGFRGIIHVINNKIKNDEDWHNLYKTTLKNYCNGKEISQKDAEHNIEQKIAYGVFAVIDRLESNAWINTESDELTPTEQQIYENAVLGEAKIILSKINHGQPLSENLRFKFTPKQMHKYHFTYACDHVAMLFAYENARLGDRGIPANDIKFMISTRWDSLHSGLSGHVVPCIKMDDGLYYGFDPQNDIKNGENVKFIMPGYPEHEIRGRAVSHVLKGYDNEPHMITTDLISPAAYEQRFVAKHDDFIKQVSKVTDIDEIKKFLVHQQEIGALTADQVDKYIAKVTELDDIANASQKIPVHDTQLPVDTMAGNVRK